MFWVRLFPEMVFVFVFISHPKMFTSVFFHADTKSSPAIEPFDNNLPAATVVRLKSKLQVAIGRIKDLSSERCQLINVTNRLRAEVNVSKGIYIFEIFIKYS